MASSRPARFPGSPNPGSPPAPCPAALPCTRTHNCVSPPRASHLQPAGATQRIQNPDPLHACHPASNDSQLSLVPSNGPLEEVEPPAPVTGALPPSSSGVQLEPSQHPPLTLKSSDSHGTQPFCFRRSWRPVTSLPCWVL